MIRTCRFAIIGLLFALTACSPVMTTKTYDASDGVGAKIDQLAVTNLMLVMEANAREATFLGGFANNGTEPLKVDLQLVGGTTHSLALAAGAAQYFAPDHLKLVAKNVTAKPGGWADVVISTPTAGAVTVSVPVLGTDLPEYKHLAPSPLPPSPSTPATPTQPAGAPSGSTNDSGSSHSDQ